MAATLQCDMYVHVVIVDFYVMVSLIYRFAMLDRGPFLPDPPAMF